MCSLFKLTELQQKDMENVTEKLSSHFQETGHLSVVDPLLLGPFESRVDDYVKDVL